MSKREEFIEFINTFKTVSPSITDIQRRGMLRQAVQNFELSVEEATKIMDSQDLMVGEEANYFEVLDLSVDEIQNQSDADIEKCVDDAHNNLYSESLRAGGLPRRDGRTQEQWRNLLNQARDILRHPQKRQDYLAILSQEITIDAIPNPDVEFQIDEPIKSSTSETTSALRTPTSENESTTEATSPNVDVPDEMVLIPAGQFQIGSQDEETNFPNMPVQTVYIDSFMIDIHPVTNGQFQQFLEENPQWQKSMLSHSYHNGNYLQTWSGFKYPRGKAEHPVVDISWYAAMAYAQWIGKRLPTETEWEKAARGGLTGKTYPWGNEINVSMANYGMQIGSTTPVGKFPPNGYGVYDIVGNVWEWCLDEYDENVPHPGTYLSPDDISQITNNYLSIGDFRVLRGGSWASSERALRVTYYGWAAPNFTYYSYGFRCVKDITP